MNLPSSWREVNLLEVCEVNPRPTTADRPSFETAVSVFTRADFDAQNGRITNYTVCPYGETNRKGGVFRSGDVLIATRGRDGMESVLVEHMPTQTGVAPYFQVLRAGPKLRAGYLLHFVQQEEFQKAAQAMNRGTGHQLMIPTQFFRNLRLPLPPLQEQDALIELFKKASLTPYIAALTRARHLSEVLAQELLLSGQEARILQKVPLSNLCSIDLGKRRPRKSAIHPEVFFYSDSVADNLTHRVTPVSLRFKDLPKDSREVWVRDVLFAFNPNRASRSLAFVIPEDYTTGHYAHAAMHVLRPTERLVPEYLAHFLRLPWLRDQLRSIVSPRNHSLVSRALFHRIELPLPSVSRQHEIVRLLDKIPTPRLRDALELATLLKKALLREGFTGQLSKQWREAHANLSGLVTSVHELLPTTETTLQEHYAPTLRTARYSVASQLSTVQIRVWEQLCDQRHPLLIDDPDTVAAFCLTLQAGFSVTPASLQRSLQQLAALGLIQHMSIPGAQGTFISAFRRYRVTELGRAAEDSASDDAQELRKKISDSD
ncbi:Type I restriction modification DNA specificity domain protein [compost metagenome]